MARKSKKTTKLPLSKSFIYISLGAVFLVALSLLYNPASKSFLASNDLSSPNVLGEDDEKDEDKADKDEPEDDKDEEDSDEEEKTENSSQGSSQNTGSVKVNTQSEGNKRETEIETSDGRKIKTKIEDDGTTKIEVEHRDLKIKYEVRNGKVETKAEDENGEEVELEDDELDDIEEEMEDELDDEGINIATQGAGLLTFSRNQIAAKTNLPLSIDLGTNQLIVSTPLGDKVVAILPDEAVENLLSTGVIDFLDENKDLAMNETGINNVIDFKMRDDLPVYEISGVKQYRLFAVIPLNRPVKGIVSTETGQIVETSKSPLTNVIDLLSP